MLFQIFITFFKIGAFTFGGGYAMIPIIEDEISKKRGWMKQSEFIDVIALSQGAPGAIAVNASIYVGYQLMGLPGAIVATLGTVLPSFIIILVIAKFFFQFRNHPIIEKVFLGIRPAIVALILSAVYSLMKAAKFGYKRIIISLVIAAIIVFFGVSPIYLILLGALGSIGLNIIRDRRNI